MVQWLRLHAPNAGRPSSIPGQGTRSYMPQLRACMPQLRLDSTKLLHKYEKKKWQCQETPKAAAILEEERGKRQDNQGSG